MATLALGCVLGGCVLGSGAASQVQGVVVEFETARGARESLVAPCDELADEWRARRWALAPEQYVGEITAALQSDDWIAVHAGLDALARTVDSARWAREQFLQDDFTHPFEAWLRHEHSNVRARALDLATRAGELVDPARSLARELAADPSEQVRLALVRHLAWGAGGEETRRLLETVANGQGVAARSAGRVLLGGEHGGWSAQVARLLADESGLEYALLEEWDALRRGVLSPPLIEALRTHTAESSAARTLVESLALHAELDGVAVSADRPTLVAGWFHVGTGVEDLDSLGALRQLTYNQRLDLAREGDAELGRGLFELGVRLGRVEDAPTESVAFVKGAELAGIVDEAQRFLGVAGMGASFLLECACAALPASEALTLARALDDVRAEEVWHNVGLRGEGLDHPSAFSGLQGFIGSERSDELRWSAASVIAEVWGREGSPGIGEDTLFALLEDEGAGWEIRERVFRWLCDAPRFQGRVGRLFESWRRFSPSQRILLLRSLPRDQPSEPFLGHLIELCSTAQGRTAPVLELLAPFHNRDGIRQTLHSWLGEALAELAAATCGDEYSAAQWRGKAIALALGSAEPEPLARALQRVVATPPGDGFFEEGSPDENPELAKVLSANLSRSQGGRQALGAFLGSAIRRRVRVEAALGLVGTPESSPAALQVLIEDYAHCDADLGIRVMAALGRDGGLQARSFLLQVALDRTARIVRRLAAVDALEQTEDLAQLVQLSVHPEIVLSAVGRLDSRASAGDLAAQRVLLETLDRLDIRHETGSGRSSDPQLIAELLLACVRAQAGGLGLEGRCFATSVAQSEEDLLMRLAGQRPAATEFRYRCELGAAGILARRRGLEGALRAAGAWAQFDGRLLLELARVVSVGDPDGLASEWSRKLLGAAEVALLGEPQVGDTEAALDRVRVAAFRAAGARGDWEEVAYRAQELTVLVQVRGGPTQAFQQAFPRFDRRLGTDPMADLRAARWQACAWSALGARDLGKARTALDRAQELVGGSEAAHAAQLELEQALGLLPSPR